MGKNRNGSIFKRLIKAILKCRYLYKNKQEKDFFDYYKLIDFLYLYYLKENKKEWEKVYGNKWIYEETENEYNKYWKKKKNMQS